MSTRPKLPLLALVGPGLLVAATGVGAGDLATAAFAGSHLGVAVLWAVVVGAALKLALTEGLARWQLVTGETLLEGAFARLGWPARWFFGLYLVPWTFFVGAALISACGVTTHALLPLFERAEDGKVAFGLACSLVGGLLAWRGGYRLFERVMGAAVAIMFTTTVVSAALVADDWGAIARGLVVPTIPDAAGAGLGWTVALLGGVGGTLTVLCYGYWIREEGRHGVAELRTCRIDLAVGYGATAVFGLAMVVIGSTLGAEARGANLVVALGERLGERLGPVGRWTFLFGAWCAVFSSLLGVWQAVPYLFADSWRLVVRGEARGREAHDRAATLPRDTSDLTRTRPYRLYLLGIATVPALGLFFGFQSVQKLYAVVGALFLPLLALALLLLNGRERWLGSHRNGRGTTALLLVTLAFFLLAGWWQVRKSFGG
jgi:Mn2+/Fe2+ NRAMP family transporter